MKFVGSGRTRRATGISCVPDGRKAAFTQSLTTRSSFISFAFCAVTLYRFSRMVSVKVPFATRVEEEEDDEAEEEEDLEKDEEEEALREEGEEEL